MATWGEFEAASPQIAGAGRRLFTELEVAFIATVSRHGRPRVHPFCPAIADGHLWGFIMDGSPKRRDLEVNGYYAIHALPGREDEEFYISGPARRQSDRVLREIASAAMSYDDADDRHILYEFLIEHALWTTWENFQQPGMRPVHQRWHAADSGPISLA
ncbi:MAG: pyridoxamine 5'-phosphate oxidase family protein [Chloroflexi bacterium]|nr:pyridoxamine 5'-phosphate oxidase family protein [Chloroflexota bacterium]